MQDFTVTLYYTPDGSNRTKNIPVTPLASQYPKDPGGWHFICVMVIDTQLSYFLDGAYVGTDVSLENTIADGAGLARVGQMLSGNDTLVPLKFFSICTVVTHITYLD